jgi:regulatory protein
VKATRPPLRAPDSARLTEAAVRYLARFAASRAMLTRVLNRRVERAARAGLIDRMAGRDLVDGVVQHCAAKGWLDDDGFARVRADGLLRRGLGRRAIADDLARRGVARETVSATLSALAADLGEGETLDRAAAHRFARRRRLGVHGPAPDDPDRRRRDLAALARAGFERADALAALDGEDGDSATV